MVKLSQPELGQEIKKRRLELGWTQSGLAEKAGTTQAHIAKIESGEYNPKGETVQRIYDAMGLQFVIKDAAYEINARLEMLSESTVELGRSAVNGIKSLSEQVAKILEKLGIR